MSKTADLPSTTSPTEAAYTSELKITSKVPGQPILATDMEQAKILQAAITAEKHHPISIADRIIQALKNLGQ